jgi:hypothetical protein
MLPIDAQTRKNIPVYSGFLAYFPHAICEVALLSKAGNDQHNPGSPLHWDRSKSGDELDALGRHLLDTTDDRLTIEEEIIHARAVAWRAMANLQKLCETREETAADEALHAGVLDELNAGGYVCTGDDERGYQISNGSEFIGHLEGSFDNDPVAALAFFKGVGTEIPKNSRHEPEFTRSPQEVEDYIAQLNTGFEGEKE